MSYNLSAAVFIRNSLTGFCLWESVASILPWVDEFVVLDLGSTDGTIELLREIAHQNRKFKIILEGKFPEIDAGVFATLANELIDRCQYENVLYYQADEIWHEDLIKQMTQRFDNGQFDLSFWRIQYANNFQYPKWYPHLVHRVGQKNNFHFTGDGMNSDRVWDAKICSTYGGEMFPKWGDLGQEGIKPYTNEMITDVSLLGGFRDNIVERRALHAPFWHEEPTIPYYDKNTGQQTHKAASKWLDEAYQDPDWTKTESPYNLPKILKYHVGKTRYTLRPSLFEAIKKDDTWNYIQNLG